MWNRGLPQKGTGDFPFFFGERTPQIYNRERQRKCEKQVQKRALYQKSCSQKCKAVCCLYDKVQLAAVKMLDAEPAIFNLM